MRVQVIGAGSWGLALARLLALNNHEVHIWCRREDGLDALRDSRESPVYLPGVRIPETIGVATEMVRNPDVAVLAVPSHVMRMVSKSLPLPKETIRVSVAKGIENDSLLTMEQVLHETHGDVSVVALSGPSHAEEVAHDKPASVVAASADLAAAETVQDVFVGPNFRVYTSNDIVGVELGGALKNVIAIAAGVCDGFELGDSAKAALITRGLAEISRLGVAMGAEPLTFAGLSGMGDLIVTCESRHSRNRAVGERIAQGMTPDEAVSASPMVAEGVRTTQSVYALAKKLGVEMPIAHQVYRVLFENADPKEAVGLLMGREAKPERA